MGKQEVQPAIVGFFVSVSVLVFASVWGERATHEEVTVSEEDVESTQEPALAPWLTDYYLHVPLIGFFYPLPGPEPPPDSDSDPDAVFESEALMDSLSPGVRASYQGWLLERKHARWSERLREEAEYAARLRRLRGKRASGK